MKGKLGGLTPWSRTALVASGIPRDELARMVPDECHLNVVASSPNGPFRIELMTYAQNYAGVREAVERLVGKPE